MSKFTKSLIGMLILTLSVVFPAFADENEVVALKSHVNDLNSKISDLQKQVQALASRPAEKTGGYVASPSENSGGLIHTAQDINMSGYAAVQYNQNLTRQSTNPATNTGVGNNLRAFDNNMDTFSVNQFDLTFSKDANPEGGVGFKLDLLFGQDARALNASTTGIEGATVTSPTDGTLTGTSASWMTPIEAYIDVVAPLSFIGDNDVFGKTLDIKVGRFVTLAGLEVIRATDNWNISRSLTFNLAAPLGHTGIRTAYQLFNGKATAYLGVNNGWDNVIDNNQYKTMEFGLGLNPLDNVSWMSSIYFGPENSRQSSHKRFLMSNVLGWDITDKLAVKSELTFGNQHRQNNLILDINPPTSEATSGNTFWWGWAGYVRYQLTEKWGAVYRFEVFRDADYFRTQALNGGVTGVSTTTWEMTFGTDYKIYDNLTGRLEYRFDKSNRQNPFNGQSTQSTIGAELIYQFA